MKLQDGEHLSLDIAGAEVSLSAAIVTEMFLDRLRTQVEPRELQVEIVGMARAPGDGYTAIGEELAGGIFAGVARGEDGKPDHYLVVLAEAPDTLKWADAMAWAGTVGDGLPTRRELALCYANVPDLFQSAWYWSGTQYAGYEAFAWSQTFHDGNQYYDRKGDELRARAVRRLPLIL
jgi:hypothetical protein